MTTDDDSCVRTAAATMQGTLGLGGLAAELVVAFERMKGERDEALAYAKRLSAEHAATMAAKQRELVETCEERDGAIKSLSEARFGESLRRVIHDAQRRIRETTQALVNLVGADSPLDLEGAVARVARVLTEREENLIAIADENIALEDKLREALASTGRARYENTLDRAEKAERELGNLLAVIHRDGGHYQGKVGTEQAVKAAHERWGRLIALADRTEVAERERDEARAALVMAENPKLLGDRLSMLCCIPPKYRIAPSCEEASAYSIAIGASLAAMQSAIADAERERDEAIKHHHEALDRLDHQTEVLDNAHPGNRLSVSGLLREAAFERQQAVLADERMHAAFVARSRAESERDKALVSLADVIAADEALLLECMTQAWGIGVGVGRPAFRGDVRQLRDDHETSTGSYSGPPDKNEFRVIIRRVMAWIASKKKEEGSRG